MANNIGYDIGNNKWFLGQVPPGQNQHREGVLWKDAHGDRVKVRIPGMHPMSSNDDATEVLDPELPWAIVAKPTTHGNLNNQSSGIWGGEWVIGFFLDSDCQIPVITQVLGNNYPGEIRESTNGTTLGKRVKRYTSGNPSNNTQIKAPNAVKSKFDEADKSAFNNAKKQKQPEGALENLTTEQLKARLDPTVTGASNPDVFNAARSAREQARAAGLSEDEVERRVLIATVAASESSG